PLSVFLICSRLTLHLPPFPTRRSSDLAQEPDAVLEPRREHLRRNRARTAQTRGRAPRLRPRVALRAARHEAPQVPEEHPLSRRRDRKSTRLNSSHVKISYAVFCLKKKN